MPPAQRDAFLRETRIATLVSLHADGAPTAAPVWFEWDGAEARLFTSRRSPKIARLRADARVSLTVAEPVGGAEAWVTIEGTATVEDEGGMDLARRLASRYYTPDRAAAALASWERMADEWVVVRITPTRIVSMGPA